MRFGFFVKKKGGASVELGKCWLNEQSKRKQKGFGENKRNRGNWQFKLEAVKIANEERKKGRNKKAMNWKSNKRTKLIKKRREKRKKDNLESKFD